MKTKPPPRKPPPFLPPGCEANAEPVPVYRPLPAAAKRIPSMRAGKEMHTRTLTKWIVNGAKLRDGSYLRLEAKRFPAGWAVTDEAVERFLDRLTVDRCGESVEVAEKPAANIDWKAHERAAVELKTRWGI